MYAVEIELNDFENLISYLKKEKNIDTDISALNEKTAGHKLIKIDNYILACEKRLYY